MREHTKVCDRLNFNLQRGDLQKDGFLFFINLKSLWL